MLGYFTIWLFQMYFLTACFVIELVIIDVFFVPTLGENLYGYDTFFIIQ